jgi:hypothetical protein
MVVEAMGTSDDDGGTATRGKHTEIRTVQKR